MKILVSNIGSTSFKFRLFDIPACRMAGRSDGVEKELASGGADRIGDTGGVLAWATGDGEQTSQKRDFANHGQAVRFVLDALIESGLLASTGDLDAVAFKTIMGGDCRPVTFVDEDVLAKMEYFFPIAPAHNPPYVAAMRMFAEILDGTPLVAAFETGFHRTIPARRTHYAVPLEWFERYGIRRYGFHGASHRYIATRISQIAPQAKRIVSCHLGGSSSLCGIRDGKSVCTSMGLSPQSGVPQSTRAGDFDPFALKLLADRAGMDTPAALEALGSASGLAAISGTGGDMRDIRQAAENGDERAKLTIDMFVTAVRDYLGAFLVELAGADAIVFTGGIGQHNAWLRSAVCDGMDFAGIKLDEAKNESSDGECRVEADGSTSQIWVIPTNEELIVARQAAELLGEKQ